MRVELGVVCRPFLRVASLSGRLTALSPLPSFLPVANSMEGFVVLTGRSLRRGRGSLASSSRSTGKAPAASQKRASQGSGSQRTKRRKTKPNEAPAEPLIYREVESNSDPEPPPRQASTQTRVEIHGQWYRRSDEVAQKAKARTKSSHIWAIKKTVLNISLLTINCNSTPCQALQYIKYHLVEPVEPVREPVRSFKWAIGWLSSSNL